MTKSIRRDIQDRTHPPERTAESERRAAEAFVKLKAWQVRMPSEIDTLLEEMQRSKRR